MFDSTAMSAWTLAATVCACATALGVLRSFMRRHGFKSVSSLNDLSSFVQEEVVSQNEHLTVLLGRFIWQPHDQKALIKLSLRAQDATAVAPNLETALSSYSGAEYAYYSATTSLLSLLRSKSLRPCYTLEVIAPASEKQIARSRPQPGVFVVETADTYRRVVKPYIDSLDPAATAWIYKCLDLSKERERVLFNDTDPETGFLLNVDTKWKTHPKCTEDATERKLWKGHEAIRDLYCLAICHRRDIRSLRDLTAAHLPLLRNIRDVGVDTVCDVYGVQPHELRVFVHYQPQFYHFHVHFTRLHSDLGCQVERAHLLQDIIDTLEADGNAYAKKLTLYYQLKANDKLLAKLVDDGAAVPTLTRAGASDAALAVGGAKHSREVTSPKQKQQQARRMSSSPARK